MWWRPVDFERGAIPTQFSVTPDSHRDSRYFTSHVPRGYLAMVSCRGCLVGTPPAPLRNIASTSLRACVCVCMRVCLVGTPPARLNIQGVAISVGTVPLTPTGARTTHCEPCTAHGQTSLRRGSRRFQNQLDSGQPNPTTKAYLSTAPKITTRLVGRPPQPTRVQSSEFILA